MAVVLRLLRGSTAARLAYTPQDGELIYDTDTDRLYIGDGSTAGGVLVGGLGTGTVTNVATGSGLTGGPITTTGTISFAAIADNRLLANVSGGSAAPGATTLSLAIDEMIGGVDGDTLVRVGGIWTNQRPKYIIGAFSTGFLSNSQDLLYHRFAKAVTIPANFGAYLGLTSQAGGSAVATGSTIINIDKAASASPNSFSNVGTVTIAAGTVTPTFASAGGLAITFAAGDVIRIQGPGTADATFAGFYATIVGFET